MTVKLKKGVDHVGLTVVFFCHDGEGNVVLQLRSKNCRDEHGRWDCGGGGVEHGDTFEKTMRNEIHQELCADVLSFELLGFREVFREQAGEKTHWVAFDYLIKLDRTQVKNGEPHKFDAVEWFPVNSLPQNLHSQFPTFFEKYRGIIVERFSHT